MEFRFAEVKDIDSLFELEKKTFISPWTYSQFEYEIKDNSFSKLLLIVNEDELIGYIDYWIIFDQATINKICIKDEYRRRGLAQKLLDICFKEVKENECMVITLEVRTSNEKAIKLYQKNGFDIVLTKPQYYSDGEDAYYMVKGVI
ncbi:MAG: ribosomal-protein-alanine N-acetyltransferase [Erysipelotrichaceae bacterium]|nr:ribosomal-protein-alanine N-acetyltransferase [Erysipelotrichaceae bacterium]